MERKTAGGERSKSSVKDDLEIFYQFSRKPLKVQNESGMVNCIIYTRVSSKKQEEGYSLEIQMETNQSYARKQGWNILGYFGGKYESAQTDERKEFNRMLSFVKKSKEQIDYILVYSVDRFSRTGANAIYIAEQLRKQEIKILAVTQPSDTSTPSGRLQQNIQFIFSQYDNDLRREKCTSGMREKLLQGYWIGRCPVGYDMVTKGREQIFSINEKGKLLRQAFQWKATDVPNMEIIKKLKSRGLSLSKQKLAWILSNTFYVGLVSHGLLEGKVVDGRHPALISRELFLKANQVSQKYKKSPHHKEFPGTPLKHFTKCGGCGKPMAGYLVKAKGLHYYKCPTLGCRSNYSANRLHEKFSNLLGRFTIQEKYLEPLKYELIRVFQETNTDNIKNAELIKDQLQEVNKRIDLVEERYVYGEITKEIYQKFLAKLSKEKAEITRKLEEVDFELSNLEEYIDLSLKISSKLPEIWASEDYCVRQELQYLLFPAGIIYERENGVFLTVNANSVFEAISCLSVAYADENKKPAGRNTSRSNSVGATGFEHFPIP